MSYESVHKWSTTDAIEAEVDRVIFEINAPNYQWERRLSVKPRRCFWNGGIIKPFSYAMVSYTKRDSIDVGRTKETHIAKWISMETYVYMRLKGAFAVD